MPPMRPGDLRRAWKMLVRPGRAACASALRAAACSILGDRRRSGGQPEELAAGSLLDEASSSWNASAMASWSSSISWTGSAGRGPALAKRVWVLILPWYTGYLLTSSPAPSCRCSFSEGSPCSSCPRRSPFRTSSPDSSACDGDPRGGEDSSSSWANARLSPAVLKVDREARNAQIAEPHRLRPAGIARTRR